MVQLSSTFVLATIAVLSASSMAIPLSQRNTRDLQERSWNPLENDISKVASVFNREDELELRADKERKGTWPSSHQRIAKLDRENEVSPPLKIDRKIDPPRKVVPPPKQKVRREDEQEISARELEERDPATEYLRGDELDLLERDLDERGFLNVMKKGFSFVSKFLREDEQELSARELEERDELDLLERDLDERGFWSSVKKGFSKVVNFAAPIVKTFLREDEHELSAREFEERELYLREDELELLERDLQIEERGFWSSVKKGLGKVVNFAAPIVSKFLREDEHDLAARDYDELVYGREYLDINELD